MNSNIYLFNNNISENIVVHPYPCEWSINIKENNYFIDTCALVLSDMTESHHKGNTKNYFPPPAIDDGKKIIDIF